MFFLSVFLAFLQPLGNTLLVLFQDAPAWLIVVAFFMVWVICWWPLAAILAIVLKWQPNKPLPPEHKIPLLIPLYLLAPLMIWGANLLKLGSFFDYGLLVNLAILKSLLLGFGLGVLGLVVVFTGQYWLGWCNLEVSQRSLVPSSLLPISLVALLVGGIEELVFRGFVLTTLERDFSLWVAAIITSIIFALLHLVWEQTETIPQLPGLWLMGMVLVLARLADKGNLGIAWGLHTGWVWAIALIDTNGLITYTGQVPEWLTGKYKKPLAGLAGIICLLGTGVILWLIFPKLS
ncbi:MAG TPA: CPBP family intramembrane glutamic endopeptidase [Nostocaceae cyanobacterium]|nr:CPBP family intramembrane glutamic endopeptidase [Nostocaceae cyanobacterium]